MSAPTQGIVTLDEAHTVPDSRTSARPPLSWGHRSRRWAVICILLAAVAVLVVGLQALVGNVVAPKDPLVYYTVRRANLPITVTERGNLESQITEEITCEVENFGDRYGDSGTQILFIVPNGSSVKEGDLLVELDSTPLKERIDMQYLSLQRAESEKIQARAAYENQIIQNEIDLAEAKLEQELATMDLGMYDQGESGGTYEIDLQNAEMEIQKTRADQLIKMDNFAAVELLYRLGYKSQGALAEAKLARLKADSDLVGRLSTLRQLTDYTYEITKLELVTRKETADAEVKQVELNNAAELAQAEATMKSADKEWEKEKERYERYESQLEKCKIYAPQDGMVAYVAPDRRGGQNTVIGEGALVRQRQKILTLPNLTKMQVSTTVHESVLDQVKVGLDASIRVDAFSEHSYKGKVASVGLLPEPGAWFSSDTKVYKTIVTIEEKVDQLKPGMTAVVQISVANLQDVLSVPVQAVIQRDARTWCYVRTGQGAQQRDLRLGRTNDKFVEVLEGLQEGDDVVLNPRSILEQEEGPLGAQDQKQAPEAKDGAGPPAKAAAGAGGPLGQFTRLDQNSDGKLTKDEVPAPLQSRFDQVDRNQDGALDASELRALGQGAAKGKRKPRGPGNEQDGKPDRAQAEDAPQENSGASDGGGDGERPSEQARDRDSQ